jgi:hypothetical protein
MKGLSLKVLTVAAALGLCPLLLSAQVQSAPPDAQHNSGDQMQLDPIVRAGTAHLNLDAATRARYRYHDGHWWFKTDQGGWLVSNNGQWEAFSPMTYINQEQSAQSDNSSNMQANTSGDYYYGTQYTGTSAHGPYSHHHFGGIQFGHWGTGYRGWKAH